MTSQKTQPGGLSIFRRLAGFRRNEDGAVTVEGALWFPFFILFMFGIGELSFVFYGQSRMLEIAQDANRGFAVGRFESAEETSAWAASALSKFSDEIKSKTVLLDGVVTTVVSIPAADLAGNIGIFSAISRFDVNVAAQQVLEF